jgi:hypothetical protein
MRDPYFVAAAERGASNAETKNLRTGQKTNLLHKGGFHCRCLEAVTTLL